MVAVLRAVGTWGTITGTLSSDLISGLLSMRRCHAHSCTTGTITPGASDNIPSRSQELRHPQDRNANHPAWVVLYTTGLPLPLIRRELRP